MTRSLVSFFDIVAYLDSMHFLFVLILPLPKISQDSMDLYNGFYYCTWFSPDLYNYSFENISHLRQRIKAIKEYCEAHPNHTKPLDCTWFISMLSKPWWIMDNHSFTPVPPTQVGQVRVQNPVLGWRWYRSRVGIPPCQEHPRNQPVWNWAVGGRCADVCLSTGGTGHEWSAGCAVRRAVRMQYLL